MMLEGPSLYEGDIQEVEIWSSRRERSTEYQLYRQSAVALSKLPINSNGDISGQEGVIHDSPSADPLAYGMCVCPSLTKIWRRHRD